MSDDQAGKRGRGRPRAEGGGRGSTLTISMAPRSRTALEEAAKAGGRSLSQTAELAIESGLAIDGLGRVGPAVVSVLQDMLRAAVASKDEHGDPTASERARDDLRARWVAIAKTALPNIQADKPGELAARAAISAMRHAALDVSLALGDDDPKQAAARIGNAEIYPGEPRWNGALEDLRAAADAHGGEASDAMKVFLALASAAEAAVRRFESASGQ